MRNVVLEVVRLRQLVADAGALRETIDKCWKAEGLGQLVALYEFRLLMQTERSRMGFVSEYKGNVDAPRDAGQPTRNVAVASFPTVS